MTTLSDRSRTALLVVDVQRGVMDCCADPGPVLERITALVVAARREDVPVVWVQHCSDEFPEGSKAWDIVDAMDPAVQDLRIHKRYGDSFESTDLDHRLRELSVGRVVVCGAMTDACIRCTAHGAFARGYDVTLVSDAHATEDLRAWGCPVGPQEAVAYLNMVWPLTSAPGRQADVVVAADVTFG